MLKNEMKRIDKQKIYDMNYNLGDETIYEWKQKFINRLFEEKSYWVKEEVRTTGVYIIKCDEKDKSAYLEYKTEITNAGIWRAVENQVAIYKNILEEDEIKDICRTIITNAVYNFQIKDARQGEEVNRMCSYILTCISTEMLNWIKEWTESERSRENGEENMYSPEMLESIYQTIPDAEGNEIELIDTIADCKNYTHYNKGYKKSENLEAIEKAIEDKLTDYEKEIFNILAIADNNNALAGRILKEKDIKEGNKLRKTDEAYRIHIKRQKDKIIKKINDNIDTTKITKLSKQNKLKKRIQRFLQGDTTNIKIIEFAINNLEEEFMLNILYDKLNDKYRKYFILNFIHNYNKDKLFEPITKKICNKITKELWKYIKIIDFNLKSVNINKVKLEATQPAPVIPKFDIDINTYLYIKKDKYNNDYKKKYAEKGIKINIQGKKIIHDNIYYLVYINKNKEGKRMDWEKARKTKHHTINLYGNIY